MFGFTNVQTAVGMVSAQQQAANFTTLQSLNALGRDNIITSNQIKITMMKMMIKFAGFS